MATIGKISAALQLVDGKKANLRQAFDDLQSQSHSLSSFNLSWSDLDSYFSSLQSSLQHKFELLQSIPQWPEQKSTGVPARPELKALCKNMDGKGLLRYLIAAGLSRAKTKDELRDAYMYAPDVAAMVLDAMELFYPTDNDLNFNKLRINCLVMLEELLGMKPEVSDEVKEKAMELAGRWKVEMTRVDKDDKPSEILGFLHLVAIYNLDGFDVDELFGYVISISSRKQAVDLCRSIIPEDRISDLIQKLIDDGKKLDAAKLSYEFKKTDEFPLVTLLKEYRQDTRKQSRKIRNSAKSSLLALNEAATKDIRALKSIIKCIEDYNLESEYPKKDLVGLVEKLEKDKVNKKKRLAASPLPKPVKRKISKHPQTAQYVNQAGPAVVAGSSHAIQYTGSNANPYGYIGGGGPLGFNGYSTSIGSNLYPPELHAPSSGYYDRPVPYSGYNSQPQHHPSYYPQ